MSKGIVRLHIIRYLHYFGKWLTDRFSKVYNPLNKLVRRMKTMNKIAVWVAGSMGFMIVGLGFFLDGNNKGNLSFMQLGGVLIVVGFFIWVLAVREAEKADKRADKRREEQTQTFAQSQEKLMRTFARELKGFREDIRNRDKRIKARKKERTNNQ